MAIARAKHPIPSRTRQLSAVAPMVLRLKTWESRSPPNLERNATKNLSTKKTTTVAGWSSPVARQAHNLKAAGSNPAPATKNGKYIRCLEPDLNRRVFGVPVYINATSTPHQKNRIRMQSSALACSGSHSRAFNRPKTAIEHVQSAYLIR